jgi:hypothetical protein
LVGDCRRKIDQSLAIVVEELIAAIDLKPRRPTPGGIARAVGSGKPSLD